MSISVVKSPASTLLLSKRGTDLQVTSKWFDIQTLAAEGLIQKTMHGRGSVYFFNAPASQVSELANRLFAIRHYCRGGAMAKLSYDRFLYTGIEKTRCYQEMFILQYLQENGVNVPKAIAASVQQAGIFYRADIITEVVENATELHEILLNQKLALSQWQAIGSEISKMHNLGVCHYDINVKNVLIQQQNTSHDVYLIDFDKCSMKASGNWQQSNIERFKRSIEKQQKLHLDYYVNKQDWQAFLEGYYAN